MALTEREETAVVERRIGVLDPDSSKLPLTLLYTLPYLW